METKEFFKRYAYVYCYAVSVCLLLAIGVRSAVSEVSVHQEFSSGPVIIIDAGHGGIDGGATSCTGILESTLNLQIAQRLHALLRLLGCQTVMTRTSGDSLATEGTTIREQKRSDLRNRVELVNQYPNGIFISIHQNQFPDSRFSGPQVFYAPTSGSRELAEQLQRELIQDLALKSPRACKQIQGVYLMSRISCPAVLLECGFLSNPQEEALLRSPEYQQILCSAVAAVLTESALQLRIQ